MPVERLFRHLSSALIVPFYGIYIFLSSDLLHSGFHGQSFWAVTSAAILFVLLSIHLKHRASSTVSIYQNVLSSVGLPRFTTTQHSFSVLWFCISHSRSSVLDLTSSKLCIFIVCCFNLHFAILTST